MRKEKSLDVDSIWAFLISLFNFRNNIERGVTMIELLKEFKKVEGNKGTKRPDFFYQFGCFKIKKLALTKENLKKIIDKDTDIFCADGGTNYCLEKGYIPKCIYGDLDSIKPEILDKVTEMGIKTEKFPIVADGTRLET